MAGRSDRYRLQTVVQHLEGAFKHFVDKEQYEVSELLDDALGSVQNAMEALKKEA